MAEFVQRQIERMYDEIDAMIANDLLTKEETEIVLRKRQAFEYRINKRTKRKSDFVHYIQYEISILNLIKLRRKRTAAVHGRAQRKEVEGSIVKRICRLFRAATHRWKADLTMWRSFVEFEKANGLMYGASRTLSNALQVHTRNEQLWVEAANFEAELLGAAASARSLFLRGLRFCPQSESLWLSYYRFELRVAERLSKRCDVLLEPPKSTSDMQVDEDSVSQPAPAVVTQVRNDEIERSAKLISACRSHALRKLSSTSSAALVARLIDIACEFDSFDCGRRELDALYNLVNVNGQQTADAVTDGDLECSWHMLARRALARPLCFARRALIDADSNSRKPNGRLKKAALRELRQVAALVNSQVIDSCFALYDQALATVPTKRMLTCCLRTALELGALLAFAPANDAFTHTKLLADQVNRVARLLDGAQASNLLSFDACADALEIVRTVVNSTKGRQQAASESGSADAEGAKDVAGWCKSVESAVYQALLRSSFMISELEVNADSIHVSDRPRLLSLLGRRLQLFVQVLSDPSSPRNELSLAGCVDTLIDLSYLTGIYVAVWNEEDASAKTLFAAWRCVLDSIFTDLKSDEELRLHFDKILARLARRAERTRLEGCTAYAQPLFSSIDTVMEHTLRTEGARFGPSFACNNFDRLANWSLTSLANRPLSLSVYLAVIDVLASNSDKASAPSATSLRRLFEEAVRHFGATSVELWMRYVEAASLCKPNANSVSACADLFRLGSSNAALGATSRKIESDKFVIDVNSVYQQAVKTLRGDLVRTFVEQFTLFRSAVDGTVTNSSSSR